MLLPRPIPNPESIFLDSMAITDFADIIVIHCVYAHKHIAVRVTSSVMSQLKISMRRGETIEI